MNRKAGILIAAVMLASCGGGDSETATREKAGREHAHEESKVTCPASQGPLQIAANDSKFDKDCLAAKAGQPFQIELDNQEDVQHNIAIHKSKDGTGPLFQGKIVGKQKVAYDVPPIDAGVYFFHCEVHPTTMKGTFIAEA